MKLELDSERIERDDLFTLDSFFDDIQLIDLLVIQRMVNFEYNRRVKIMDKRGR